ncbi:MAG: sigma-70 family RNA polymerase sigma factor [Schleiferiaceae bacterium]|nr:sigma-70 family RNA polymerase sigma factor [Schleiferiaceae bacterium]
MDGITPTDAELIALYKTGDESGLAQLIDRHKNRVYTYIFSKLKDEELANDVFQDTFVKVINTIKTKRYNEEGKFLPWVMRIAHNLVIDHFRREKRMPTVSSTQNDYELFDNIRGAERNVENQIIHEQIENDLHKLIEYLPEEQKEVLKLRHYSEMSFKEIAEQTGVSINTALGRMRYALINLRRLIEKHQIKLQD